MVELIQALLQLIGLITLIYLFLAWGLSGGLKKFFTFREKKKDDVNSGAKFGWVLADFAQCVCIRLFIMGKDV